MQDPKGDLTEVLDLIETGGLQGKDLQDAFALADRLTGKQPADHMTQSEFDAIDEASMDINSTPPPPAQGMGGVEAAAREGGGSFLETLGSLEQSGTRMGVMLADWLTGKHSSPEEVAAIGRLSNPQWNAAQGLRDAAASMTEDVSPEQKDSILTGRLPRFAGGAAALGPLAGAGAPALALSGAALSGGGAAEKFQAENAQRVAQGLEPLPNTAGVASMGAHSVVGAGIGLIPGSPSGLVVGGLKTGAIGTGTSLATQWVDQITNPDGEISLKEAAKEGAAWGLGGAAMHAPGSIPERTPKMEDAVPAWAKGSKEAPKGAPAETGMDFSELYKSMGLPADPTKGTVPVPEKAPAAPEKPAEPVYPDIAPKFPEAPPDTGPVKAAEVPQEPQKADSVQKTPVFTPNEQPEKVNTGPVKAEMTQTPVGASAETVDAFLKPVGEEVSGVRVGKDVPNESSIDSSIDEPNVLSGVREVPMSEFDNPGPPTFYSSSEKARTEELANDIKSSGRLDPLIVVYGKDGPYILEGAHRFDAARILGLKSFPAKIVIDEGALRRLSEQKPTEPQPAPTPAVEPAVAPVTEPEGFVTSTKNAVTEAERTIRDAAPIEAEASRDFGTVWDEAKAASPETARNLVDELAKKHRPVSDAENALILRRKIEVRNAFEDNAKAMEKAKEAGDADTLARTRQQNAVLLDELDKIDIVNKNVGRESGRGLNARKMEAKNDMTLAAVMTRMSAENGYEPLPAETQGRIAKLVAEREAAYKELNDLRSEMDARLSKVEADVASLGSAPRSNKVLDFFDRKGDEAMVRLKKRLASPSANIFLDPEVISDLSMVAAKHIAHGVDAAAQLVKDFGEEIKPHLDDILMRARALHDEQTRKATPMERREKAMERTIGRKQEMLKTGDVMPKKRTVEPPSRRLLELQAEAARYDKLIEHEREKIRRANMKGGEKAADVLTRWNRAWVLSSPAVFGKLAAASAWRMSFMPIREGIGAAVSKAIPEIASKATLEGGGSVEALARGYSMGFKNAIGDAWRTLRQGGTEMDQAFGKKHIVPTEGVEYIGAMHAAMKAPLKRVSFEYGLQKGFEGAIREGLDIQDPLVQMRVGMEAYKFAERQLFLQDNAAVQALKAFNAILKNRGGGVGRATATTIDIMTPVVKIPTNIIAEAFEHVFGTATGSWKAAKAYRKGIESLSRPEAEDIMRSLKNGTLGLAAMALGWGLYKNLGGQYDRTEKKLEPGTMTLFGVKIPASALHLPFHEVMMAAATARRYAKKQNKDIDDGVLKAMLGLVEEIPLARESTEIGHIFAGERDLRDIAGQRIVPQGIKDIAKWTDRQPDREAHGFIEQVKKGIPGLRKSLRPKR